MASRYIILSNRIIVNRETGEQFAMSLDQPRYLEFLRWMNAGGIPGIRTYGETIETKEQRIIEKFRVMADTIVKESVDTAKLKASDEWARLKTLVG